MEKQLVEFVNKLTEQDFDEDKMSTAAATCMGLEQLRRIFSGTKFENIIADAMMVYDIYYARGREFVKDDDDVDTDD